MSLARRNSHDLECLYWREKWGSFTPFHMKRVGGGHIKVLNSWREVMIDGKRALQKKQGWSRYGY